MSESGPSILFLVELRCLQCGRIAGTLETPRWPWPGPASLRRSPRETVQVADCTRWRCTTCSGNLYSDEVQTTRVYPRVSWDDLVRPRGGRSLRWLVAQRGPLGRPMHD